MRTLVVYEHQLIHVVSSAGGDSSRSCINIRQEDELAAMQSFLPTNAFERKYRAIKFSSFCGVIQLSDLTIEILPKIYSDDERASVNRKGLLDMLIVCLNLSTPETGLAQLALQHQNLLHIFVDLYCKEVFTQSHQGLLKQYIRREENLYKLKGKILWHSQVRKNIVQKQRIFCEFDELSEDNIYNQTVKTTLRLLARLTRNNVLLQNKLQTLLNIFDPISNVEISANTVASLDINRLVKRYDKLLLWSEWLLRGKSPSVEGGNAKSIAFLFDMNKLFEDYIYKMFVACTRQYAEFRSLRILQEKPIHYLLQRIDNKESKKYFRLKPDICIFFKGEHRPRLIIDTKWKRLKPDSFDTKWNISQADIYQMHAYAHSYDCDVVLLYPDNPAITKEQLPSFAIMNQMSTQLPRKKISISSIELHSVGSTLNTPVMSQLKLILSSVFGDCFDNDFKNFGGKIRLV